MLVATGFVIRTKCSEKAEAEPLPPPPCGLVDSEDSLGVTHAEVMAIITLAPVASVASVAPGACCAAPPPSEPGRVWLDEATRP